MLQLGFALAVRGRFVWLIVVSGSWLRKLVAGLVHVCIPLRHFILQFGRDAHRSVFDLVLIALVAASGCTIAPGSDFFPGHGCAECPEVT